MKMDSFSNLQNVSFDRSLGKFIQKKPALPFRNNKDLFAYEGKRPINGGDPFSLNSRVPGYGLVPLNIKAGLEVKGGLLDQCISSGQPKPLTFFQSNNFLKDSQTLKPLNQVCDSTPMFVNPKQYEAILRMRVKKIRKAMQSNGSLN